MTVPVKKFKPMLAHSETPDLHTEVSWPKLISPKLDGFRCVIIDGNPRSRKLLPIPNLYVEKLLTGLPHGLDGELIVGDPTHEKVFSNTAKGVGKRSGEPDFTFWVFDDFTIHDDMFVSRHASAIKKVKALDLPFVRIVEHLHVSAPAQAKEISETWFNQGYEGAMLRSLGGPYKFGRTTLNEQSLLKIKFWQDAEGEILRYYEQTTNTNEATVDELGHTKRSTAKDGKVPNGTLGSVDVRWHTGKEEIEFSLAAGGTNEEVAQLWAIRDQLPGQLVTFKFNGIGVNGRPRFPGWKGLRSKIDV